MDIANIAGGALVEQADFEIRKVLENIADPNTDAKKVRKVTITISFKPNESREMAGVEFQTKASLVPALPVGTAIAIDKDNNGNVVAEELRKGAMKGQQAIDMDTGEILESNKVTAIK